MGVDSDLACGGCAGTQRDFFRHCSGSSGAAANTAGGVFGEAVSGRNLNRNKI